MLATFLSYDMYEKIFLTPMMHKMEHRHNDKSDKMFFSQKVFN
jgi:hypothetical protein